MRSLTTDRTGGNGPRTGAFGPAARREKREPGQIGPRGIEPSSGVLVLIAVICVAWLVLGLSVAVLLGRALQHADAADRGTRSAPAVPLRELRPTARASGAG
ncbi:hypothetical protein GCM10027451_43050 [Geodermatophilus aquaeductus]